MLLYPGAFYDITPVLILSHRYKIFILYDGMPKSEYFNDKCYGGRFNTVDKLVEMLVVQLKVYGAYKTHEQLDSDSFEFTTQGGQTIYYFLNTLSEQINEKPILKDMLIHVEGIYLSGYLLETHLELPNLKEVYTTNICLESCREKNAQLLVDKRIIQVPNGDHLPLLTFFGDGHVGEDRSTLFEVIEKHPKDVEYKPKFPGIFEEEMECGSLLDRY